jgi:hypothetical protein
MKLLCIFLVLASSVPLMAQPARPPQRSLSPLPSANSYASNLVVIREAQAQALQQAGEMLPNVESERERSSLQAAIREMELSSKALDEAEKSPDRLPAAIAAQQNAYEALLKVTPREYRMTRNRQNNNSGQGSQSGQPQRQQMDQLEMNREENRYETERQARAEPNAQQREQLQTADKLKELAQRQQDLNSRLQELQTALQSAQTEQEREELQRQLKRLRDEQRQMLADVDEMRQQMEQSSNASQEARQQMEQTRSDMQRAAEEMEKESASGALAAGTRAQQNMQNLRDELRRETSSQFSEQMRELRNQARDLARQQEEIARDLDALEKGPRQSLDNSRERKELVERMQRQESGLTNLLGGMRAVTEQSENSEPLLSRQLYDTLRRADQARTEDLMRLGSQLTERGFLPQAGEAERSARQNIEQLRNDVERAAESVLGNEAESLRYAERELQELTRAVESEIAALGTNNAAGAGGNGEIPGIGTNQIASASQPGNRGEPGSQANGENPGREGAGQGQANERQAGERQQGEGQPGEGQSGEGQPASDAQNQQGAGTAQAGTGAQEQNQESEREGSGRGNGTGQAERERGQASGARPTGGGTTGGDDGGYRLRQIVEQWGRDGGGSFGGNPITGGGYVDWADRLRDVERVLDPADLRGELAAARERLGVIRAEYRESGRMPSDQVLKQDVVRPLTQVRVWLQQELARQENPQSLVPLDRDPVPENFSELVKRYYEKLGSAQ